MSVPQSILDLTPAEKLQLVEDLWNDLAAVPESVPIHQWQQDELTARKERLEAIPESGTSWEIVKQRICHRHSHGDSIATFT